MMLDDYILNVCKSAKLASNVLSYLSSDKKNSVLEEISKNLRKRKNDVISANTKDIKNAHSKKFDDAFIDRLTIKSTDIQSMRDGLAKIVQIKDPIGNISFLTKQPSGIKVGKMRVPLGVIAIIYESRPNVTIDAGALCLKSGNAAILRGGAESISTNLVFRSIMSDSLKKLNLPLDCIQIVEKTERVYVEQLFKMNKYINLLIPRGGKNLIKAVNKKSKIPILKHLDGICHVFIDSSAKIKDAIKISDNSKTHRFGTCNTIETLLVHKNIAENFLPKIYKIFLAKGVEVRGDRKTLQYLKDIKLATTKDWRTEYLAPIISIKVVSDVFEAIDHINEYGSNHTDSIVTQNHENAERFLERVDSSSVMVNTSTRFADGFEYGLGSEIGISTDKLHARGPVGTTGLTTEKWIVYSNGEIRK